VQHIDFGDDRDKDALFPVATRRWHDAYINQVALAASSPERAHGVSPDRASTANPV
jgi:hypothetical protein